MPFVSQAQRKYMYSQHPELAREFEDATPKGKKLPKKKHPEKTVKRAYEEGVDAALERFGIRLAGDEVRLQIPRRQFHGWDSAWRDASKKGEGEKKADSDTQPLEPQWSPDLPVEKLTELLQKLDLPPSAGLVAEATKDPLDRTTLWGGATNPEAGDAGTREPGLSNDMGSIGTI